ncbi:MAG: hypothetical protein K1Y01_04320 [Vicinamibacteria bacterium]|nr:hypothetical protein [Vicinamibacteria bacterium]
MKRIVTPWFAGLVAGLFLVGPSTFAQAPGPAPLSLLGQVESVEASSRTLKMKVEDGASLTIALAEKGTVMKVAPGEKSLQNAVTIPFDGIAPGDRVLVRGGARTDNRVEGALRVVIMAQTDLAARNESEQRAWRERGIAGTLISADPANGQFILQTANRTMAAAGAATAPVTLVVDAKKATLHRYSDTSVKFDDARPAGIADMAAADQVRVLGTRSEDGKQVTAERVVFGSFKTMALAIEKIDAASGTMNVKDLESNHKFTIALAPGASIRRIPAEMAAMFGGAGRPGAMGGGMGGGMSAPAGGRPEGARGQNPGAAPAMGMGGRGPGGGGRGGRGMEDIVERMPAITLADLKKDDWVGAVVGRIDPSGKAVAFNMLAGIEAFASRANRSGGVDVGMPAGLLDGALGVP